MGKKHKISCIEALTILPPVVVALYHDRSKLQRDLHERKVDVHLLTGCYAQTFPANYGEGTVHFVLMEPELAKQELWQQLSSLAHEASHIADNYFQEFGEESPGHEERAYLVQAVAGCLFDAHLSWLRKQEKGKKDEEEN